MSLLYNLRFPRQRYIWATVRILHETDKAVLVKTVMARSWIPKSRIRAIRLRNSTFEVYVTESTVG